MAASAEIIAQITANPCAARSCDAQVAHCYAGQWTAHAPHHYEVQQMAWMGGGTIQMHCPGPRTDRA